MKVCEHFDQKVPSCDEKVLRNPFESAGVFRSTRRSKQRVPFEVCESSVRMKLFEVCESSVPFETIRVDPNRNRRVEVSKSRSVVVDRRVEVPLSSQSSVEGLSEISAWSSEKSDE